MDRKEDDCFKPKWFIAVTLTTLCVYLGFRYILPLIFPFIIAYFLAWIIQPATDFLYRKFKLSRGIGGALSLLVLLLVAGTGIAFLIKTLIRQAINVIKNMPIYITIIADKLDYLCEGCDELFGLSEGTIRAIVDENILQTVDNYTSNIVPSLTERTISFTIGAIVAIGLLLIIIVATVLIVKDLPTYKDRYESSRFYQDIHKVTERLAGAGIAYLRSQIIIALIVACICVLGLILIKNDYALLLGLVIAIMDALPILGSAIILIPWSIIMIINGNIYAAAILITTYLLCQITREVLEPRLIGNRIGIKPITTLIAIYIGVRLFHVAGFVLGPIGLVIIITVVEVIQEKGLAIKTKDSQ